MNRRLPIAVLATLGCLIVVPSAAATAPYRAHEVVVAYAPTVDERAREATERATGTDTDMVPAPRTEVLRIEDGKSVPATLRELRSRPGVLYAVPNMIARASGFIPNDRGRTNVARGWQQTQWNFLPDIGVNAPDAWANLIAARAYGGRGVTVAVLDTGVAYENRLRFRRSPDLSPFSFVQGYDFIDRDRYPNDVNGHGTWIASLVAERTHNGFGLTGLAYGARIMPLRVLDSQGLGDASTIAAGIRYAASHGARVVNLSVEFDDALPAFNIPQLLGAIRFAAARGVVIVASSGNESLRRVAYPARAPFVTSVGATTEHLCLADYSNEGVGLDIVAPGGGGDAPDAPDPAHCRASETAGRDIFQLTFTSSVARFGYPGGFQGTSMSAPHVAAAAALVIASGVIGRRPSARAVEAHLKSTARDLGAPGYDTRFGAGLLDAGRATTPSRALRAAWRHASASASAPPG